MTLNKSAFDVDVSSPETRAKKTREEIAEEIARGMIREMSPEARLAMAGAFIKKDFESGSLSDDAPKTPDELWDYIYRTWKVKIARVAVCHDHDAPFDFICLGFFEVVPNLFCIGPRGGGKSYDTALLMELNSRCKPGCVAGDTPIDCPRDHRRYPLGLPISQIKPGQLVWTFNEDEWIFELKPVARAWMSREGAPVFLVTLDDGSTIRATADHRFLRRDGRWLELRELNVGDSLMPLYRDWEPYVRIRPDATNGGGMVKEYHAVADTVWPDRKGLHVDHVDERRENSDPENLQLLTNSEHCAKTMTGRNVGWRRRQDAVKQWADRTPEELAEVSAKISASMTAYAATHESTEAQIEGSRRGGRKGGLAKPDQVEYHCDLCNETFYRFPGGSRGVCPSCKTESRTCPICRVDYVVPRKSRRKTCSRSCGQRMRKQIKDGVFNHKIVSIEPDGSENVWDMEVEGNHNFVTAGVVLHNCESMVFGAVDEQNRKVFQDMVEQFINGGMPEGESEIVGEALASLVQYVNGSKVKSYPGTKAKMNGQHPPKAHAEEVEIFKAEAYAESRNMAASKILKDGSVIKAQNFGTSTRKYKNGRVDKIYQAFLKAKKAALKKFGKTQIDDEVREYITITSPWYCVIYCLFEIAAQVPGCRSAPENRGRPDGELCRCNIVQHGTWDKDGREPRTLESVCKGRLYRSRGHRSYEEVVQLFLQNERGPWEAQQECIEAETEGVYVKHFSRRRHGLSFFPIDPANGPFYTGTDWGTTHFACTLWCQYLERAVEAIDYEGKKRVIPAGSRIILAEFYEDGLTSHEMGERVIVKEVKMANHTSFARLPIRRRWADVQGAGDKKVWRKMGLPTTGYGSRVFSEHVKEVRGKYEADRCFVVVSECPHYCDEIEAWREDEKGSEVDENFNHAMAAGRYLLFGMLGVYNDAGALAPGEQGEVQRMLEQQAVPAVAVAAQEQHLDYAQEDAWRTMV